MVSGVILSIAFIFCFSVYFTKLSRSLPYARRVFSASPASTER